MIERIARRYEGRWLQGYARGKLRSDPVFAAAFELLKNAPLPVLDIGCGVGLFEFSLRERGYSEALTGFDFDTAKIMQAQRIATAHYAGVSFSVADTAQALPAGARGHVVIFDVLHYLDAGAQRDLLDRVAERIAPGGLCLIRETPGDASWRFRATQIEETVMHALLWMKSRAVHFPSVEEVIAPFVARGFSHEVRPLWGRTPFNSHLFVLRCPH
ncbi:MAG: class I SAM-dependent methyltransferase [Chthoniobacteraceae bacterium]